MNTMNATALLTKFAEAIVTSHTTFINEYLQHAVADGEYEDILNTAKMRNDPEQRTSEAIEQYFSLTDDSEFSSEKCPLFSKSQLRARVAPVVFHLINDKIVEEQLSLCKMYAPCSENTVR